MLDVAGWRERGGESRGGGERRAGVPGAGVLAGVIMCRVKPAPFDPLGLGMGSNRWSQPAVAVARRGPTFGARGLARLV